MIATQCPTQETLHALSTGRLEDSQSEPLLDHLRDCPRCRAELDAFRDADDSLIASLRGTGDDEYDAEPDCNRAIAKALGALAIAGDATHSDWQQLPQNIGEYEIVRPLGRGGMGRVFLARHSKLGRQVALKLALIDRLADPRVRRRFEAEMRAVGKLSHPNIVTAHDAREIDGTAVLVTEFIEGLDLAQLVRRTGPLPLPEACEIVCRVAAALQYTADEGFVHRDIKPSNIMLSSDGQVKLLDLGLARFHSGEEASEMTGAGQAMGTADYVAPEQVTDGRSVDVRADIYSLGCTLFHLLTGGAPFSHEDFPTAFAKMNAHVSTPPPSLAVRRSDCPADVVRLVDAMLAKQPDRRPAQPIEVASRLEKHAAGADLQALAARAAEMLPAAQAEAAPQISTAARPQTLPWRRRKIPATTAVAAGLFGFAAGLALGIIITITRPDGSKVVVTAPEGSDIDIREAESVSADLPAAAEASIPLGTVASEAPGPFNEYEGYWRAWTATQNAETADSGIDYAVVERDRLHLLKDRKLVASGQLKTGRKAGTFVFHDQVGGVTVVGRFADLDPFTKPGAPTSMLTLILSDFENLSAVPASLLNDYPLAFPMKLDMERLTGSAAAAVEAVLREQVPAVERDDNSDAPISQLPENDIDIREAEAVPTDAPFAVEASDPFGAAVAPATSAVLSKYQGYWQVLADQQTDEQADSGIDHVVVDSDHLYLLQDGKLVMSGRIESSIFGRQVYFHDEIRAVRGVAGFHDNPPFESGASTHLRLLAMGPKSRLKDFPISLPTSLFLSPLTGSAAAAVEAVLREQLALLDLERRDDNGVPTDSDTLGRLQGVWLNMPSPDIDPDEIQLPVVTAFRGTQLFEARADGTHLATGKFRVGNGSIESLTTTITDVTGASRRSLPPFSMDLRFLSGSGLQLLPQNPFEEPVSFDAVDPKSGQLRTLKQIGDLPQSAADVAALQAGRTPEVAQALEHLWNLLQAAGNGPQAAEAAIKVRDAAYRTRTQNNLEQIGLAMHNFEAVHGKLPGSVNIREGAAPGYDSDIQPFSWRVAILPFVDEQELFEAYRFDQPWDGPDNIKLLQRMPDVYRSPFVQAEFVEVPEGHTLYQGLVGPQTALGSGDGQEFRTFSDGTSNTLLIVESQAAVPWTKPEDIPFETAEDARRIQPIPGQPLSFLTADGNPNRVMDPVDYDRLSKLITRDGGEPVEP